MEPQTLARLVCGILLLFGGWILYCAGIRIIGFLLGVLIGVLVILVLFQAFEIMGVAEGLQAYKYWIAFGLGFLLGLVNLRLIVKFYLLLVAGAFGLLGLAYQQAILEPLSAEGELPPSLEPYLSGFWGAVLFTVVFAVAGALLHRYLVILLSSAAGASLLLPLLPAPAALPVMLPVLTGGGILVQLLVSRRWGVKPRSFRKEAEAAPDKAETVSKRRARRK